VNERSEQDTGEAGDGRSDAPMDLAMEMATAGTPPATVTAARTTFELMVRNENGKRGMKSDAPDPCDWRSSIARTMQQQVQESTQLHRTVGHVTNLLKAQVACEEALWLGMSM